MPHRTSTVILLLLFCFALNLLACNPTKTIHASSNVSQDSTSGNSNQYQIHLPAFTEQNSIQPSCPAAPDSCHAEGAFDGNSNFCTYLAKSDGSSCQEANNLCALKAVCQQGQCVVTQSKICTTVDDCGVPFACQASSGCPEVSAQANCQASQHQVMLNGCPGSGYVAALRINDSNNYNVLLDTGSTTLAVAAASCSSCQDLSPLYQASTASIGRARSQYADGSWWSGEIYQNNVQLVGASGDVNMRFTAIDTQSGMFAGSFCTLGSSGNVDAIQGILGLGLHDLAISGTDAFLENWSKNYTQSKTFTVELCDDSGYLWLGGLDPNSSTAPIEYTPMDSANPYYAVFLEDLHVGEQSVFSSVQDPSLILDTGSSNFIMEPTLFAAITNALQNDSHFYQYFGSYFFTGQNCFRANASLSRQQLDDLLPKITLSFPQPHNSSLLTLQLPATYSYLVPYQDTTGNTYYCPGLEQAPQGTPLTMGASMMRSLTIVFAIDSQQIGFVSHPYCNTP